MGKRPVDIEQLLQWAYRDELPKRAIGGLTGWEKTIYLGTSVDEGNFESGFPVALGPPHPDALLIDYAVRSLSDVTMLWEHECAGIMGNLAAYVEADDPVLRRMQFSPACLVTAHARMGTRPRWDLGPARLRPMFGRNNKPVVRGITAGRRYQEGAYCPLELELAGTTRLLTGDSIAREIACARAEYLIWRRALGELAAESWDLRDHVAQLPRAAERPWITDTEQKHRVLRDISASGRVA